MRIGTERGRERERGKREQQERDKEEANKRKKEDNTQKILLSSPVYSSSFKEDVLPLFDPLLPAQKEGEKKEEEERELDIMTDHYPLSPIYTPSNEEDASVIVNNLVPESTPVDKGNKQTNIGDTPDGEDTEEDNEVRTQTNEDTREVMNEDTYSDYIY